MVVIHIKKTETEQFLFETPAHVLGDVLIRDLVEIWNKRIQIQRLTGYVEQLAKHGPAKPLQKRGIDHIQEEAGDHIERGEFYSEDPIGERNGNAPTPQLAGTLREVCADGLAYVSSTNVAMKKSLTVNGIREKVGNIRGAVTMAYPMGLPSHDAVRLLLEEDPNLLDQSLLGGDILDPQTAQLWFAGKELFRDQHLSDRIGRNEKTKVIAALQRSNAGPPVRQPGISEEERKAMMAHYFKKQEEMKKLAEVDDDDYLHSDWANPHQLKSQLRGTANIRPFAR